MAYKIDPGAKVKHFVLRVGLGVFTDIYFTPSDISKENPRENQVTKNRNIWKKL